MKIEVIGIKIRYIIYAVITLNIFFSCNRSHHSTSINTSKIIKVDFDEKCLLNDSIFENQIFIPLQTTSNSIIGGVKKIVKAKNKYFILDPNFAKALFVFNDKGNFLYKVGITGKGPGEVMQLNDFDIIEKKNELYILDYRRILVYDLDGNYKKEFTIKWPAENLCIFNDNELYLYVNDNLNLKREYQGYHLISTNINCSSSKFLLKAYRKEIQSFNRFRKINDTAYIACPQVGYYTIFKIKNNDLKPIVSLDFGKRAFNWRAYEKKEIEQGKIHKNEVLLHSVLFGKNFTCYQFSLNSYLYCGFYFNIDKSNTGYKFENYPVSTTKIFDVKNDSVFTIIDTEFFINTFKNHKKLPDQLKTNTSFLSLKKSLVANQSNPVIVIYKIKSYKNG